MNIKHIPLIDYNLPDERIAKYPLADRSASKLLLRHSDGSLAQDVFRNISNHLPSNSLLVINTTRVMHARLHFQKSTGAAIELFCLSPHSPANYEQALAAMGTCRWNCLVGNKRKWKGGKLRQILHTVMGHINLSAEVIKQVEKEFVIEFCWDTPVSFSELLAQAGQIPIPPYLNRSSDDIDKERYQTIYAQNEGSVAAPTSGLHFTPEVFQQLKLKGIEIAHLNLNVSAGTFQPVKTNNAREHEMHKETFSVHRDELLKIARHKGPVISVGTTSLRTLESLYWLGIKISQNNSTPHLSQWENETLPNDIPVREAYLQLIEKMNTEQNPVYQAATEIMIHPGYDIRVANGLITNFHMPKSTLLLLVSAFINDSVDELYNYALNNNFRFLSYGDSSLIFR